MTSGKPSDFNPSNSKIEGANVPKERSPVPDRKFRLSNLEMLLLTAIVVGLAFMIRVVVAPGAGMDRRLSANVSQLEQRMNEVADRLNLVGAVSEIPVGSSETKSVMERLDQLEQRIGELERRVGVQGGETNDEGVVVIRDSPRKTAISE